MRAGAGKTFERARSGIILEKEELIKRALDVRERAYAPFSNFKVGAAVVAGDGTIFTGCNVESASYGLTVCAERVAIWKAVSEGATHFTHIAVVADTEELTPPCGVCRQIIWEFCGDIPVTFSNLQGKTETVLMSELLPRAFDTKFLK
ncbi:MAG: cytidine deaminase [Acidobacteria bacterium]|nr:cytidine deaminase [Acidobacteriota bacterium]